MVVPITDVVKMALSVADISAEPIIGIPLIIIHYKQGIIFAVPGF